MQKALIYKERTGTNAVDFSGESGSVRHTDNLGVLLSI